MGTTESKLASIIKSGSLEDLEKHLQRSADDLVISQKSVSTLSTLELENPIRKVVDTRVNGGTVLHWAVYYSHKDIVKYLLQNGASVHKQTQWKAFGNFLPPEGFLNNASVVELAEERHKVKNSSDSGVVKTLVDVYKTAKREPEAVTRSPRTPRSRRRNSISTTVVSATWNPSFDPKIAVLMTNKKDLFYPSKSGSRGCALLVGNGSTVYCSESKDDVMETCKRDVEKMSDVLENTGYKITIKRDLTRGDMLDTLNDFREIDHSEFDSFVFYFSGHGLENCILSTDLKEDGTPKRVDIKDIVDLFQPEKCTSLEGKPKIFIFDCCRGNNSKYAGTSAPNIDLPPPQADTILIYASALGYQSYISRNDETKGLSIYTYYLTQCMEMNRFHKYHLEELLVFVQKLVQEHPCKYRRTAANNLSFLRGFVKFW